MRNMTVILIAIFILLRFGYPAYQDWRLEKQVRQQMKTAKMPEVPDNFQGLPIKMAAENNYPKMKFTYTLTELNYKTIPNTLLVQINEAIKEIPCRSLFYYRKMPQPMWQPVIKILKEDKVSLMIEVKDKNGQLLDQNTQILSQCRNFEDVFNYTTSPTDQYQIKIQ